MRATLALGACAVAAWLPVALAADRLAELQQVVAAERAFAARAQIVNPRQAFVEYFAPDAIAYAPFPAPAFPALRDGPDWPVNIQWRPVAAAISGAGDMGYTTGPAEYRRTAADPPRNHGHYASVWQRQPDGRILVRIDIGIDHPAPAARMPDWTAPISAPPAAARIAPERRAQAERALRELDARVGTAARDDVRAAFAPVLFEGTRLHRGGRQPVVGASAVLAALRTEGDAFGWLPEGVVIAESGDFGFSYGRGRWTRGAAAEQGDLVYLNVWQLNGEMWRLLIHVSHAVPPRKAQ